MRRIGSAANRKILIHARSSAVLCLLICASIVVLPRRARALDELRSLKGPDYVQISPSGDKLVFCSAGQVWLISTGISGDPKPLVKGSLPAWSPHGKRLAFYSQKSGSRQLWVMDLATLRATQITKLAGGIRPAPVVRMTDWIANPLRFSWSPDGKKIVFASQAKAAILPAATAHAQSQTMVNQLFIVNVATRALRRLTHDDAVYFNPAWSPDGHKIVCASAKGQGPRISSSNLNVIELATGSKIALTSDNNDPRLPLWSPDGNWIAFLGGNDTKAQKVYVIPENGGVAVAVTPQIGHSIAEFAWMPDSWSLVLLAKDAANRPILTVPISGRPVTRITGDAPASRRALSAARNGSLAWVEDGGSRSSAIVFKSPDETSPRILVHLHSRPLPRKLGA